ncbi:MAG: bifunctional phosphopantothenoylcysteine decarboxylase/phosphopantothenate--cysteine ligase CoaBC [Eubacterium sp.]|nr:bifunctional phosphopantothenoylcysteine decarboxylase/phosphopantothenate--cysteine ligase CoaBC [Eubacterium sp.]
MLTGKKVVLGVTGSISAYKMANVASMLMKLHCEVRVVLTENAAQFITPVTFETLTKQPCLMDTFERMNVVGIPHITLGQKSDLLFIAPASADILGKMAYGIADDLLTSTVVAATCPVLIAPAMNACMYRNPIVQENIIRLKAFGYEFIEPEIGHLACDVEDIGKLPNEEVLVDAIVKKLAGQESARTGQEAAFRDLSGIRILVTAGPTRESLDPVRFITNHSSGRMGYAIAAQAAKRGAQATLVTGPVQLTVPEGVRAVSVTTAEDMYQEVMKREAMQDIIVKAAAVADYRPKQVNTEKTKKQGGTLLIELERTKDILAELGTKKRPNQCLCGFSMETEHVLLNSRQKLEKKNADLIAANSIREHGAGFGVDTNHLVLITREGEEDLGMLSKEACAGRLLDRLYGIWKQKQVK